MYACELCVTDNIEIEGLELKKAKFKLSIHVEERDGEIVYAIQYDNTNYSKELMENFMKNLNIVLENIINTSNTLLKTISIVK